MYAFLYNKSSYLGQYSTTITQRETQRKLVDYGCVSLICVGVNVGDVDFILFVHFFWHWVSNDNAFLGGIWALVLLVNMTPGK